MPRYQQIRKNIKTGDLVLFSGKGGVSDWIKLFTGSRFSHVGLAIVLPDDYQDMVLLLESTTLNTVEDIETGQLRRGVQLVPLSERVHTYSGQIYLRPLNKQPTVAMRKALGRRRKQLSRLPYEKSKLELLRSAYDGPLGENTETLSSLFCSELVAECYQAMGLLRDPPNGWPSNEYTPRDFSTEAVNPLKLEVSGFSLKKEVRITGY